MATAVRFKLTTFETASTEIPEKCKFDIEGEITVLGTCTVFGKYGVNSTTENVVSSVEENVVVSSNDADVTSSINSIKRGIFLVTEGSILVISAV